MAQSQSFFPTNQQWCLTQLVIHSSLKHFFHLPSRTHTALVLLQPEWSLTLWFPLGIPSHLTIMQLPRALSLKLNWSPYTPYPSWSLAQTECSFQNIYKIQTLLTVFTAIALVCDLLPRLLQKPSYWFYWFYHFHSQSILHKAGRDHFKRYIRSCHSFNSKLSSTKDKDFTVAYKAP